MYLPCSAAADLVAEQREKFLDAEKALQDGDTESYQHLKQQLTGHPLYGYLEYWELRGRLSKASVGEVQRFLDRYRDQPIAARLRSSWLHRLGKRRDWKNYLRFYQPPGSTTLQCYEARALLARGDRGQALQATRKLWLVGKSQPAACDPAFAQLYAASILTSADIWQRIRLAFANQKPSLAGFVAKRLSATDREWVKRWQYAHRRPTAALKESWADQDTPLTREILVHAIERLARHKPGQAWKHWQELATTHDFSDEQAGEVKQTIALHAALRNHPSASLWMGEVPETHVDKSTREWRIRVALLNSDWEQALLWLDKLEPGERNSDLWTYWRARALEGSGATGDALTLFGRLGEERSYHGFLAADRLHRPYQMNDARVSHGSEQLVQIEKLPGVRRARELYLAGKHLEARREWYHAIRELPSEQLKLAALLAHRWGWHDRAIITATQARYWSDLTLRYPLPHRDTIFANASQYDLDPSLIYGVIRQESAFMEEARSPVGALGLMQLMPATGRQTARALNIGHRGNQALLKSDHNIRLGSAYLSKLIERYNGSPVLAAAAYNAGPHRVSRWLPEDGTMDADLWMEVIPYPETRDYVRRVLSNATIFQWRLQRPLTRISQRMPEIRQRY
jgi:soluble lytic murein transglycosylase